MNATLWVIWLSLLTLFGSAGLHLGGHVRFFISAPVLDEVWRDGYEQCQEDWEKVPPRKVPDDRPDDWPEGPPDWHDTADHLAELARPHYEPLARGAGAELPPVTTASCSGEDNQVTLKGDSPGPGRFLAAAQYIEGRADGTVYGVPIPGAPDFVFVPANPGPMPSPIFDELLALGFNAPGFRPLMQLATPLASPPGGVAPEPPAPRCELAAEAGTGDGSNPSGAGADPWQEIVAANQEVWEPFTDTDVFRRISGDLDALRSALSAPVQLPPWKDSQ